MWENVVAALVKMSIVIIIITIKVITTEIEIFTVMWIAPLITMAALAVTLRAISWNHN